MMWELHHYPKRSTVRSAVCYLGTMAAAGVGWVLTIAAPATLVEAGRGRSGCCEETTF